MKGEIFCEQCWKLLGEDRYAGDAVRETSLLCGRLFPVTGSESVCHDVDGFG